jgi:GNAT superfamily N-acetyltransferase
MCDEWMPRIELGLTWEEFHQLPRNPAFKYEYFDGKAVLSPRPRHFHGLLEMQPLPVPEDIRMRRLQGGELPELVPLFNAAFWNVQPFGSLSDARRGEAALQVLERTRTGGDGPLIEQACFMALSRDPKDKDDPSVAAARGAILITLLPEGDPSDQDSYYWPEPPPADCITRRLGRPHLTWIFVSHLERSLGLGSALLAAAVKELLALGFKELLSTFLLGNDSSMLWHWRNGFRLLPHPWSYRGMRRRIAEFSSGETPKP